MLNNGQIDWSSFVLPAYHTFRYVSLSFGPNKVYVNFLSTPPRHTHIRHLALIIKRWLKHRIKIFAPMLIQLKTPLHRTLRGSDTRGRFSWMFSDMFAFPGTSTTLKRVSTLKEKKAFLLEYTPMSRRGKNKFWKSFTLSKFIISP